MGRWGIPVNIFGILYGAFVTIDVAWPRAVVYNPIGAQHWYYKWAAFTIIGLVILVGAVYYLARQFRKSSEFIAARQVMAELPQPVLGDDAP
jgi:hypothetical protein